MTNNTFLLDYIHLLVFFVFTISGFRLGQLSTAIHYRTVGHRLRLVALFIGLLGAISLVEAFALLGIQTHLALKNQILLFLMLMVQSTYLLSQRTRYNELPPAIFGFLSLTLLIDLGLWAKFQSLSVLITAHESMLILSTIHNLTTLVLQWRQGVQGQAPERQQRAQQSWPFIATIAALPVIASTTMLLLPRSHTLAHLLPCLISAVTLMLLEYLFYRHRHELHPIFSFQATRRYAIFSLIIFSTSWVGSNQTIAYKTREIQQQLLGRAIHAAQALNLTNIEPLTFTANDLQNPHFQRIRDQLISYGKVINNRSIYTLIRKNDQIFYGPENLDVDNPIASTPGTLFENPPPELLQVFSSGEGTIIGPYPDPENGPLISAYAPIFKPGANQIVAVTGIDIYMLKWREEIFAQRSLAVALMAIIFVVILGTYLLTVRKILRDSSLEMHKKIVHYESRTAFGIITLLAIYLSYFWAHQYQSDVLTNQKSLATSYAQIVKTQFNQFQNEMEELASYLAHTSHMTANSFENLVTQFYHDSMANAFILIHSTPRSSTKKESTHEILFTAPAGVSLPLPTGSDLAQSPVLIKTIDQAATAQLPTMTPPMALFESLSTKTDAWIFFPYTSTDGPSHRQHLGVHLHVPKILTTVVREVRNQKISLKLHDVTDGSKQLLSALTTTHNKRASLRSQFDFPIFFFGRIWMLEMEFENPFTPFAKIKLWILILTSILIFAILSTTLYTKKREQDLLVQFELEEKNIKLNQSEDRWKFALENSEDGIWEWNRDQNLIQLSEHGTQLLGLPSQENGQLPPKMIFQQLKSSDAQNLQEQVHACIFAQSDFIKIEHEWSIPVSSTTVAQTKWFTTKGKVISRNEYNIPTKILGSIVDITARKLHEQKLQKDLTRVEQEQKTIQHLVVQSEQLKNEFELFIHQCSDAILQTLEIDRISIWMLKKNQLALVERRERNDSQTSPADQIISTDQLSMTLHWLEENKLLSSQNYLTDPHVEELRRQEMVVAQGLALLVVPLHISNQLVGMLIVEQTSQWHNWENDEITFIGQVADQVAMNMINNEKEKMQQQLIQSSKMASLGVLSAGVAHEINNPLTIVLSNLYFLKELIQGSVANTPDGPQINELLTKQERGCQRIHEIVKKLNTYAHPNSDQLSAVDLVKVVQESIALVSPIFAQKEISIEFTTQLAGHETAYIWANTGKLQQVLMNFLTNARDAFENIKHEKRICLNIHVTDQNTQFAISDNGQGIPTKTLNSIYDPFFTTKAPGQGTGLGLSITRTIIESLNGTIDVHSTEGEGTTFTLTFPNLARDRWPAPLPSPQAA